MFVVLLKFYIKTHKRILFEIYFWNSIVYVMFPHARAAL